MHPLALAALAALVSSGSPPGEEPTRLGVQGLGFTLNGAPAFLLGMSYYGALGASAETVRRDLDDLKRAGFNWIRVWATWAAFGNDVSAVDGEGNSREPYLSRLGELLAECDRRGLVVDVTLSRQNGVAGPPRLRTLEAHRRAVETLLRALGGRSNWYLDLSNERDIKDARFTSFADLKELRAAARRLDPARLVTASHAGDIDPGELREYLLTAEVDFICPHRPRGPDSPGETAARTRRYVEEMKRLGRVVPVHYQEPFRRGFAPRRWEPGAEAFLADLAQAVAGGAAGWCFHNGDQKDQPEDRPRRSFDLRAERLLDQLDDEERKALAGMARLVPERPGGDAGGAPSRFTPRSRFTIEGGRFLLNGEPTYRGSRAEGLLMNVRMVNAVFEDAKRPEFDADLNTGEFTDRIPEYVAHGVRAFTICLQGGMPGYEGAVNSAFDLQGGLRPGYLARVRRVIEACDRSGAAVILGCYYQRQDQVLRDETAVRAGVAAAARWVKAEGFANVLLEIANEYPHGGFDHRLLKSAEGEVELIELARRSAPGLPVSTSGIGDGKLPAGVAAASDFLLFHLNGVPLAEIPGRIQALKRYGKPMVVNEDDKRGEEAARAAELCVSNGASWGLMLESINQAFPFTFQGAADDPVVYRKLRELTSP